MSCWYLFNGAVPVQPGFQVVRLPLVVTLSIMPDVTQLLDAAAAGDPQAAAHLLPLVYDELRKLAAARISADSPGHTLDATALVHEAYLRLVRNPGRESGEAHYDNRGHFFAAAAEAMRRILVESARQRMTRKHGGNHNRIPLGEDICSIHPDSDILAAHEVLDQLTAHDPASAQLVKLHIFGGLTLEQAAEVLGVSPRTAYRNWAYARAWMFRRLGGT